MGLRLDIGAISQNYMFVVYEEAINPSSSWEAGALFVGAGYENQNGWNDPERAMGAGLIHRLQVQTQSKFLHATHALRTHHERLVHQSLT